MASVSASIDNVPDRDALAAAVERDLPRTMLAAMLFDMGWAAGMAFATVSVFVPSYLRAMNSPKFLIGLAASFPALVTPLQLFSDRLLGGANRKRNIWLAYTTTAVSFGLYGALSLLSPPEWRWPRIIAFILADFVLMCAYVMAMPVYFAILTDNCPVHRRGRLFAYRISAMGVLGLVLLYPARFLLDQFSHDRRALDLAIIIGGVCYLVAALMPLLIRDHIDPARLRSTNPPRPRELLRHAWDLLRGLWSNANYRVFIFFLVLIAAATSLGPFFITFSRDVLAVNEKLPTRFQAMSFVGCITAGLFMGSIADRFGYRITLLLMGLIGIAAFATPQAAGTLHTTMVVYALYVVLANCMPTVMCNLGVELMPGHSPADLTAAANLFALCGTTLTPWLCGAILDAAGAAGVSSSGYHIVFTIALVLALIGALGTALLVQEPRTGRVYVIKDVPRA